MLTSHGSGNPSPELLGFVQSSTPLQTYEPTNKRESISEAPTYIRKQKTGAIAEGIAAVSKRGAQVSDESRESPA